MKPQLIYSDLLQINTVGVSFYALKDRASLYLIDGGFIGGIAKLRSALKAVGWDKTPIKGIILTHGHLDHILNIGRLAEETGAWIAAPKLDHNYYSGTQSYSGISKVTGLLESIGRSTLEFKTFEPDQLFEDGFTFNIWHGLQAIHLPGHTAGHSGLYCEKLKLLFCGDLFASFGALSHLPPMIFNVDKRNIIQSIQRSLDLPLKGILPNHCYHASPSQHLATLKRLQSKTKP